MSEAQFRYILRKWLGETRKQVTIIQYGSATVGWGPQKAAPHPTRLWEDREERHGVPPGIQVSKKNAVQGGFKGRRNHISQRGKPSFLRWQPLAKVNQGVARQRKVKYYIQRCLRNNRGPPNMGFPLKGTLADTNLLLFTFSSTSRNCCFSSFSKLTSRKGDLDYSCWEIRRGIIGLAGLHSADLLWHLHQVPAERAIAWLPRLLLTSTHLAPPRPPSHQAGPEEPASPAPSTLVRLFPAFLRFLNRPSADLSWKESISFPCNQKLLI